MQETQDIMQSFILSQLQVRLYLCQLDYNSLSLLNLKIKDGAEKYYTLENNKARSETADEAKAVII